MRDLHVEKFCKKRSDPRNPVIGRPLGIEIYCAFQRKDKRWVMPMWDHMEKMG